MKKNKKPKKNKLVKNIFNGLQFVKYASACIIGVLVITSIIGISEDSAIVLMAAPLGGSMLLSKIFTALHLV